MPVTKTKCFHPYTRATVNQVERWLSAMAEQGVDALRAAPVAVHFSKISPRAQGIFPVLECGRTSL